MKIIFDKDGTVYVNAEARDGSKYLISVGVAFQKGDGPWEFVGDERWTSSCGKGMTPKDLIPFILSAYREINFLAKIDKTPRYIQQTSQVDVP